MSVTLISPDGEADLNIANGTFAALTDLCVAFGEDGVDRWNRCHDPQFYPPESLRIMAKRVEQLAGLIGPLKELANHGGAHLS